MIDKIWIVKQLAWYDYGNHFMRAFLNKQKAIAYIDSQIAIKSRRWRNVADNIWSSSKLNETIELVELNIEQ